MIGLRQYPLIILQFRFPVKQMDFDGKKSGGFARLLVAKRPRVF
jgi:hypothetical protein